MNPTLSPFDFWFNLLDAGESARPGALIEHHQQTLARRHGEQIRQWGARAAELLTQTARPDAGRAWQDYAVDGWQRSVLFLDLMRRHGNSFLEREQAGGRPVLAFDYRMIVDGRQLERPVNYALVRIVPSPGTLQRENGRPYIIIDPRAGHGSGIGGFKHESEVGVALREGHPVYFVIFFMHPEPRQTLADVCAAEADFVREVRRRHPDSPKPIVMGNCQGGWAALLLAATHPDITGPLVVNGAPVSYWAGQSGSNPLRYLGGLFGGILPALLLSDLGNGQFDGANLVLNFEILNPAATWWKKYYDVFADIDAAGPDFLQFEGWWSAFYFMNEAEIHWIVENLFIGNKLVRGKANLDESTHVDLRNIRSPIIVFASRGDNITPPQQALNWIADVYPSVREIKVRGQRILYTLHDNIGYLGIFVASKIAQKEHKEIISTLKAIEALSPGLYEMVITEEEGEGLDKRYAVAFEERSVDDIRALGDTQQDEPSFAAVARLSELGAEGYDLTLRPWVRAAVTPATAEWRVRTHPLRVRRYALSDHNPWLAGLPVLAERVQADRRPVAPDNPFLQWQRLWADAVAQSWNAWRDLRDVGYELMFFNGYGTPAVKRLGEPGSRTISDAPLEDLRGLTDVQEALDRIDEGGFGAAVIRMLILLARSRGAVRRDRLERSNRMLNSTEPFASMPPKKRARLIHRQSLIVDFEPERALLMLPCLMPDAAERAQAMALCEQIAGPRAEMELATIELLDRLRLWLAVNAAGTAVQAENAVAAESAVAMVEDD